MSILQRFTSHYKTSVLDILLIETDVPLNRESFGSIELLDRFRPVLHWEEGMLKSQTNFFVSSCTPQQLPFFISIESPLKVPLLIILRMVYVLTDN